jgi:hypothetical protein
MVIATVAIVTGCRSSPEKGLPTSAVTVPAAPPSAQGAVDAAQSLGGQQPRGLLEQLNKIARSEGKKPALLTPGPQEERATAAALAFLRGKEVDVSRFTHARAVLTGDVWDVVLLEAVDKPQFGSFEYSVSLRLPRLRVVKWSKMQ